MLTIISLNSSWKLASEDVQIVPILFFELPAIITLFGYLMQVNLYTIFMPDCRCRSQIFDEFTFLTLQYQATQMTSLTYFSNCDNRNKCF